MFFILLFFKIDSNLGDLNSIKPKDRLLYKVTPQIYRENFINYL